MPAGDLTQGKILYAAFLLTLYGGVAYAVVSAPQMRIHVTAGDSSAVSMECALTGYYGVSTGNLVSATLVSCVTDADRIFHNGFEVR